MLSYDNKVLGWHPNHVRERTDFLMPLASPRDIHKVSPENSVIAIDQCTHMSGKTDSAYSSFSKVSVLPEFSLSLGYSEDGSLSIKQMPYMDSGYMRGIYNPSVGNSDNRQMYENKIVKKCRYRKLESDAHIRSNGNTQVPGMLFQALAKFSPLLPPSPSPATLGDNYEANRNVDETHDGICFNGNEQGEACFQEIHKVLPLHTPANCCNDYWLLNGQKENAVTEKVVILCPPALNTIKKCRTAFSTKLAIQENLKSGSLAKTTQGILSDQNSINAYNIPKAMSSKSSLSLHTSCNVVNDPQENKQYLYACSVHKPPFTEAGLTSRTTVPRKQEGQLYGVLDLPRDDDHSGWDHSIYKSSSGLSYADNSVPNNFTLGITNAYEDKECTFHTEEENSSRLLKTQKQESQILDRAKTAHGEIYETFSSVSNFSHDSEEATSQLFTGLGKTKQKDTSGTNLLINPRQKEMLKPFHFSKLLFSKAESQSQNDTVEIKINRKTTPLLYYLSGGRNSSFMSQKNQIQEHEDFLIKSPNSAEPIVIPKDSNNTTIRNDGFFLGSPASSLDEKFSDYREKLKVAQQKVLRETSFKRRDLQMSLPIRLKESRSSRPSIQHLRSLSLSSTNEDSKLVPPLKKLGNSYPEDESKKLHTVRTGGRKRATKEQKKMSYSEPEKLNRLGDQREQNVSWGQKNARSQSEEISGQDTRIIRSKVLESQGRDISKARLKQIQHNALLEYMERKTGQQPVTGKNSSQQNLSLQVRSLDSKRFLEGSTSNPSTTKKLQNIDSFCQFPASGRIHESPVFPAATITDRCNLRSPESELLNSKVQPAIREEISNSQYGPAQSFFQSSSSASSKARVRSKSASSPVQDTYSSVVCSSLLAQDHEYYPTYHRFYVSEKDCAESEENETSIEKSCCEEITLESSLIPKENSKMNSQGKQEISENSEVPSATGGIQLQHMENDTSDHSENRTDSCAVLLNQREHQNLSTQSADLKVLQNEHEHQFPTHDTDFSIVQTKSPQDQKYEHLAVGIIAKDESLIDILMSHPSRKTVLDLMEGLFPVNLSLLGRSCRRKWGIQSAQANDQRSSEYATDYELKKCVEQRPEDDMSYVNQIIYKNRESLDDSERITSKKRQLISSIRSKLRTLQDERELILMEAQEHGARGKALESLVQDLCKPNECERYLMFIGDLEKVVSLLLCLSSRLARIHNAMEKIDENTDAEEKQSLNERHRLLSRQQEDAKDLKENLDRRERVVSDMLSKYMTENQLQDYRHFIQEKTILLIEQKDLEEHIKFLEEQLERLENNILP